MGFKPTDLPPAVCAICRFFAAHMNPYGYYGFGLSRMIISGGIFVNCFPEWLIRLP